MGASTSSYIMITFSHLPVLENLAFFNKKFHESTRRGFCIWDVGPWNLATIKYNFRDRTYDGGNVYWNATFSTVHTSNNGYCPPEEMYARGCDCQLQRSKCLGYFRILFRPLIFWSNYGYQIETAPWNRFMWVPTVSHASGFGCLCLQYTRSVIKGLATLCADNLYDAQGAVHLTYFSKTISNDNCECMTKLMKQHLSCQRWSESDALGRNHESCTVFHITFFELVTLKDWEVKESQWKIGELFEGGPRHRYLRESAFSVRNIPILKFQRAHTGY